MRKWWGIQLQRGGTYWHQNLNAVSPRTSMQKCCMCKTLLRIRRELLTSAWSMHQFSKHNHVLVMSLCLFILMSILTYKPCHICTSQYRRPLQKSDRISNNAPTPYKQIDSIYYYHNQITHLKAYIRSNFHVKDMRTWSFDRASTGHPDPPKTVYCQ